ncbi:hypothetical protein PC113_g18893 [Phytophthora cactorum]|uniref:RxLR effector protein n=1 Tax=Phytophthora cactorum TaxID=29920 RepID=A0A8T0YL95_9STRA|nr:hypothetical protein PC113_g18893 [Phytophthora cactorum]KAG3048533.1 hypothetical protein PC121_g19425 [Phytophthora cactorum]KAG3063435.1 hypothetical protein PC122_g18883 [Phytophthora cactorum]
MRLSVFMALVVATFVATCISFTSAESVAQISDVDDNSNLQGARKLAKVDEWWLQNTDTEERVGSGSFVSRLKGRVRTSKASGVAKTQKLNDAQVKTLTKEVATTVKKDRRTWPVIKKGLKILYGTLLAGVREIFRVESGQPKRRHLVKVIQSRAVEA